MDPGAPLLATTAERGPGRVLLRVAGEVDMSTAGQLSDAIAAEDPDAVLGVDLSAVTYLDSSGVNALLTARAARGDRLWLVRPSTVVMRVLTLTATSRSFRVADRDEDVPGADPAA